MIIESMNLIGCDNIQYCSNNLIVAAWQGPSSSLHIMTCQRLTTNMKTVFANKCRVLVWLSKSVTILIVVALSLQNGFANDEKLISTSIACVHNFSLSVFLLMHLFTSFRSLSITLTLCWTFLELENVSSSQNLGGTWALGSQRTKYLMYESKCFSPISQKLTRSLAWSGVPSLPEKVTS